MAICPEETPFLVYVYVYFFVYIYVCLCVCGCLEAQIFSWSFFFLDRRNCSVDNYHPLVCPTVMYRVSRWPASTAHYCLDLLPESLIHQNIHNWVDSGIEHDQGVVNILSHRISVRRGIIPQEVDSRVTQITNSEDGSDSNSHQSNSFSYFHHTLQVNTAKYQHGWCKFSVLIGLATMRYQNHAQEIAVIKSSSGCSSIAKSAKSRNISCLFSIEELFYSLLLDSGCLPR